MNLGRRLAPPRFVGLAVLFALVQCLAAFVFNIGVIAFTINALG